MAELGNIASNTPLQEQPQESPMNSTTEQPQAAINTSNPEQPQADNTTSTSEQQTTDINTTPVLAFPTTPASTKDIFVVPPLLQQHLQATSVPFYQPKLGHQLSPDSFFAVRCNEAYMDVRAALENERAYVRKALLQANHITFYRCAGSNPVLVMHTFDPQAIEGEGRAIDLAAQRCTTITPQKRRVEIPNAAQEVKHHRLTGTNECIIEAQALMPRTCYLAVKPSHLEGCSVAHAYLNEEQLLEVKKVVLVEEHFNIISSQNQNFQVTMRDNAASTTRLIEVGLEIQKKGALTTMRTSGTLRVTLPTELTSETFNALKAEFASFKIFTDTPMSVWAPARVEEREAKMQQRAAKQKAIATATQRRAEKAQKAQARYDAQDNRPKAKLAADFIPHPSRFEQVARALGAEVLELSAAKYTDGPMSALIALPNQEALDALLALPPFTTDDSDNTWVVQAIVKKKV